MAHQTDKVTFKGNPVTLVGTTLNVGDKAPDVKLTRPPFDTVKLSDLGGKIRFISVTPSVDTGVCNRQVHAINERAAGLSGVAVLNVSVDLPFALSRFCGAEGIANVEALSDYKEREFGDRFGVYMSELGLLARSIFILDRDGVVRYKQVVPEMTDEPDYEDALRALSVIAG